MIFMFILLAGSSTRMGSSTLKQFINISKKEIFEYSLETFDKIEKINKIFLVAQKDNFEHINQIILNKKYNHEIEIIEGGATRQESVFNSLNRIKNIASSSSIVIFHDACRPLITKETALKIIDEAEKNDGATAYCPLFDSICEKNNENFINNSLNREKIVKLQTPQAFKFDIIYTAHETERKNGNFSFTDDTSLLVSKGFKIKLVESSILNFKVTNFDDLFILKRILEG